MIFINLKTQKEKLLTTTILLSFISILLITIQTFRKAYRPIGYDLTCYLTSSRDFFNGKNPYTIDGIFPYIYPQFFNVFLYPLTIIPYWMAVLAWLLIGYISLFFTIKILIEIFDNKKSDFKKVLNYFSAINLLLFSILQDNFLNGQVNILLLFFCTLFLKYLNDNKRLMSGLFLALSIAIKITPAILTVWLVFNKNYRIFLYTLVISIIMIIGLPYIFIGEKTFEYYSYYLDNFILHKTTKGNEIKGFSLTNFYALIHPKIAIFLSVITMIALNYWNQISSKIENIELKRFFLFSLYLISILLISPLSEGHHLIMILPAYLFILNYLTKFPNKYLIAVFIIITFIVLFFKNVTFLIFCSLLTLYFVITNLNVKTPNLKRNAKHI